MYYVPIYLQYVKGYSALVAGALMLAFTFPQALWGVVAGFYVSKTNHYKHVIVSFSYRSTTYTKTNKLTDQRSYSPHTWPRSADPLDGRQLTQ